MDIGIVRGLITVTLLVLFIGMVDEGGDVVADLPHLLVVLVGLF